MSNVREQIEKIAEEIYYGPTKPGSFNFKKCCDQIESLISWQNFELNNPPKEGDWIAARHQDGSGLCLMQYRKGRLIEWKPLQHQWFKIPE